MFGLKIRKRGRLDLGKFSISWKHVPMTRLSRCRFLWRSKKQFGRHHA